MTSAHRDSEPFAGGELAITQAILESRFSDPSYALGALYRAAMTALSAEPLAGKHVLDYGSGSAEFGIWMATENADVQLLDPSPANIELGLKRAEASGVARRVKAVRLTDPANLDMFAAGAFDLVFARTPLVELAATPGALDEIARIMKPDARMILAQAEAPGRARPAMLKRFFAEVQTQGIASSIGLLARLVGSSSQALIAARR